MKILYTFLILIIPISIFAQSNYRPGYVLQTNGDTLKGFINYREWDRCPKSIDFKRNSTDNQILQFTPINSKGFQVNGLETYLTYKGLLSTNITNFTDLPDYLDTTKKQASVFLKQLVTGKYFTLYYNDDTKIRFLITENNNTPVELLYFRYYADNGQITHSDVYKRQFKFYISKYYPENNKLNRRIESTDYQLNQLGSLVNEINDNKPRSNKSTLRFFAGLALNSTKTTINNIDYIDNPQSLTYWSPKINAGIDILPNSVVQKYFLRTELSFSYIKPRFNYNVDPQFNIKSTTNVHYSFDQYTAAVTPQMLLNVYNKTNFKLYVDGGMAFNFSAYSNQEQSIKNTNIYNAVTSSSAKNPYKLASFWTAFPLQTGIVFNKTEVHFTYLIKSGYTRTRTVPTPLHASNQAINVGLKYFL